MNNKKKKEKQPLLSIGIGLAVAGIFAEAAFLIVLGILFIILHIFLLATKKAKKKAPSQQSRFADAHNPQRETASKRSAIEYDAETGRAQKRTAQAAFTQVPHMHFSDPMRQAQAEIRNLKNIRYARSELSGKTLSDTVIWHTSKGVCSSVVQVIRQGNLRYPDLSDRALSEKILADKDLMEHLARSLEWERRTELRYI